MVSLRYVSSQNMQYVHIILYEVYTLKIVYRGVAEHSHSSSTRVGMIRNKFLLIFLPSWSLEERFVLFCDLYLYMSLSDF